MRPDFQSFVGSLEVGCKAGNDSRLKNDVSVGSLEQRDQAPIQIQMPLSFFLEVNLAFLEGNLFGCQREASPLSKRSELMTVNSNVRRVNCRFWLITRCVIKRVKT